MTYKKFVEQLFSPIKISRDQLIELLVPFAHQAHVRRHSAEVIISRVRLTAAVFFVAVPLWSVIDWVAFPWPQWLQMTLLRFASAAIFAFLAVPWEWTKTRLHADLLLATLLIVPPIFYLLSINILGPIELTENGRLVARLYALLPDVVLAGLAIFPLTAFEVAVFATPAFAFTVAGLYLTGQPLTLYEQGPTLWLMVLIAGSAMFSGMSQLHYMTALVNRAMVDPLTGCYTRRSGGETLDLFFRLSIQQGSHFTLAFFDIDLFKSINDNFGHEEGDNVLKNVAESVRKSLRTSDVLVRWGGEEFLIVLTNTDIEGARVVIERLRQSGFGQRPDGSPLTVSIGVAERTIEQATDWPQLVEVADLRMYNAKHLGRNRAIYR